MMRHRRAPRMQYRRHSDLGAEVLAVSRDAQHRLAAGLEQGVIDHRLILISNVTDLGWQREDDVEVWNGQQFSRARFHPLACLRALALRAMPVAAAVVGDGRETARAVLATRDVAAEFCRAAALDGTHDLQL